MGNDQETILLLTYYSRQEDRDQQILRQVIGRFCGPYLPFDLYLSAPLKRIFRRVIVYDFLQRRGELGLRAMNTEVLALVKEERPKYVLWTSFNDDIRSTTLETIKDVGAIVVGWFFDDEWRFKSYSRFWIPYLDYCVTNALSAVPAYRKLGARVIQTIPNTGIAVDVDWSHLREEYDLTFVGSDWMADRRWYLDALRTKSIPVAVMGGSSGYLPFQQMLDIFQISRINLNYSKAVGNNWPRQIKGRVFQVCLAGGFLLTEQAPGIEKYFEPGKEIVCFDSPREMVENARYYLSHETERRAIARAGWERATREYTSSHMVARVFEEVEQDLVRANRYSNPTVHVKMNILARGRLSAYNLVWGRAQIEENYTPGLWKDDLALARSYAPWSTRPWFYRILASLPSSMRLPVFSSLHRIENRRIGITLPRWLTSLIRRIIESL